MDRFANVFGFDFFALGEIGNSARHFQDSVISACAQMKIFHGMAEHLGGRRIEGAELFDLTMAHAGIGSRFPSIGKPGLLNIPRRKDPMANIRR